LQKDRFSGCGLRDRNVKIGGKAILLKGKRGRREKPVGQIIKSINPSTGRKNSHTRDSG